jgi:hypothetical protein
MFTYSQRTGILSEDGRVLGVGYSGAGPNGQNNPAMQEIPDVGPIPRGRWLIGPEYTHPHLGPLTMALSPAPGTETFGRADFRIHGDSMDHPGAASNGCVILWRGLREKIAASADRILEVTE